MSSHHIVRENQEPALLVASANVLKEEHLGQLLEWSPTILTHVDQVDFLLALGIKVDVVFGELSSEFPQESIKNIPVVGDFLSDSMEYVVRHRFGAVNILTDFIPDNIEQFANQINIILFTPERRSVYVRDQFEKWMPKGETIYISETHLKSIQGLEYMRSGVFQTEKDGLFTMIFNTDQYVLVGEEL